MICANVSFEPINNPADTKNVLLISFFKNFRLSLSNSLFIIVDKNATDKGHLAEHSLSTSCIQKTKIQFYSDLQSIFAKIKK